MKRVKYKMIYLDYAANTPVDREVLDCYYEYASRVLANPNSKHRIGMEAKQEIERLTERIAGLLGVKPTEIIYTSGASEANNLAIKGLAHTNQQLGKHIISTCLEHPSVSGALTYLQSIGYEVDLVDITPEGLVDLEHLKELLRKDTILLSVCGVDSELGVVQQQKELRNVLEAYPNCYFHSDATQAIGKIEMPFRDADCYTLAPHKFFGLNSSGILVKRETVILEPLIHGGASTTIYRSGTPDPAMLAATAKALELAVTHQKERYEYAAGLRSYLQEKLQGYSKVRINSTKASIPHILNLSVEGVKAGVFTKALEESDIYVSIKSACSVINTPSRPVYAVTRDKKNAMCSWRISLSHLVTMEELEEFMNVFDRCYQRLTIS